MHHDSTGWYTNATVNGQSLKFKIDTGASVTAIPRDVLDSASIVATNARLRSAGGQLMQTLGTVLADITINGKHIKDTVYVVDHLTQPLLGKPAIEKLGLVQFADSIETAEWWIAQHPTLFGGLGLMKSRCTIKLRSSVEPFALPVPRRVAAARRAPLRKELDRMVGLGVIERIERPTDWCSPCLVVPKKSGEIRLCIDYTCLNRAVKREYHPLPSTDEVLAELKDARVFSKLDANSGYWQMELAEASKDLTTFITPFGRFRCHRLPFGISSAPEIFQREMQKILAGSEGTVCMMDDILVYGQNVEEHDRRLTAVLERLAVAGLTLNKAKCSFCTDEVKFLGHVVSSRGIAADPEKISAIMKFPAPQSIAELRRFLGMVNYLGKFSAQLAESTPALRLLLSKTSSWDWNDRTQAEFETVKRLMSSAPVLVPFDLQASLRLSSDASSFGLGAVLLQLEADEWRPIAYASRSMIPAEKNYAQIEKEALAICWAAERFHFYLAGRFFEVETDHKPLVSALGTKEVSKLPIRLQRFRLRMMSFDYSIFYTPGPKLIVADALSRQSFDCLQSVDCMNAAYPEGDLESVGVGAIFESLPLTCRRLAALQEATAAEEEGRLLVKYASSRWPDKKSMPEGMQRFVTSKDHFTVVENLVFYDSRIYIPRAERSVVLDKIHAGHLGETKCIARAAEVIWWPGMTAEIRSLVKGCPVCTEFRRVQREPLLPTPFPSRPWVRLGLDFCQWKGDQYLVMIDYYSRYIVAEKMTSTTSRAVVACVERWLCALGIPWVIVSDNGPQLTSSEFQTFLKAWNIRHVTSSPHYPQSNGEAERAVQTVKSLLDKNRGNLQYALIMHRDTPLANGYSPSQLLFGRSMNSTGIMVDRPVDLERLRTFESHMDTQQAANYDARHAARTRHPSLEEGQQVKVRGDEPKRGIIVGRHDREVTVDTGAHVLRRNRSQVVPVGTRVFANHSPIEIASPTDPPVGGVPPLPVEPTVNPPVGGAVALPADTNAPVGVTQVQSGAATPPVGDQANYVTRSGRTSKPPDRMDL